MELNTLLYLGISLAIAYVIKRIVDKLHIPSVTGYVIIGIIIGKSIIGFLNSRVITEFSVVSDLALAIIAFSIGVELNKTTLSKLGSSIVVIAFGEGFAAFLFVSAVFYALEPDKLYRALIFGSIASATAPAATVYVIQQYKAKGPLTSTILGVVGIDDAISLTIYVFASLFAQSILLKTHLSVVKIIITPIYKIALSVIIGAVLGFAYIVLFKKVRFHDDLLLGIGATILIGMGLSDFLKLSELLTVMTLGSVLVNSDQMLANRSKKAIETFSPIILPLFFMYAGARLDVTLITKIGILGLIYTIARFSGKVAGASLGAIISKAPSVVKKYIGFSLLPQVGVAVALSLAVQKQFGTGAFGKEGVELANIAINILLFTTVITETIGPFLTKTTLTKAQEINMRD
ncbi:MAG: sodium:proton exchanger [Spirochaetes bacterium]|nr:MAG: sodium:proton exchanger [Spirochaetota bacterium]